MNVKGFLHYEGYRKGKIIEVIIMSDKVLTEIIERLKIDRWFKYLVYLSGIILIYVTVANPTAPISTLTLDKVIAHLSIGSLAVGIIGWFGADNIFFWVSDYYNQKGKLSQDEYIFWSLISALFYGALIVGWIVYVVWPALATI